MKAFVKTLKISIIALMLGTTYAHAQWDTLTHLTSSTGTTHQLNDIYFRGSYGFAVGNSVDNASTIQVGLFSKSTDGGLTWNSTTLPFMVGTDSIIDLNSVYFTTPNDGYAVAKCLSINPSASCWIFHYGALLKTTDGGATWNVLLSMKNQFNYSDNSCIEFSQVQFLSLYDGYLTGYVVAFGPTTTQPSSVIYHTFNGGNNWTSSTAFTLTPSSASYFSNSGLGVIVGGDNTDWPNGPVNVASHFVWQYPGKIGRSTDGGSTWSSVTDSIHSFFDVSFPTNQTGYVIGRCAYDMVRNYIMKTSDGGQTWNPVDSIMNFTGRCIYFINDTLGYVGGVGVTNTPIYKTIDGGQTWTPEPVTNINNYDRSVNAITFSTPQTGYAAVSDTVYSTLPGPSYIYGNFSASSCAVFCGPDTTFCQQQGQLFATPGTPSPDYVFSWSPSTGLSDSTAQNPFVNHVYNQQYVVTMTDTVTMCSATDTIIVSAYESVWGPQYICSTIGDSTLLDLGPGATNYQWQFYSDTAGNSTFLGNLNQQTYWATQQGHYLAIAFSSCGALTSYIEVDDTCGTYAWVSNVWPGDANYDLTADAADALNIGLGYGTTGATRPSANNSWTAQPMNDWTQNFVTCNYKHADCDGNGTIDANDTLPITLNYGLTHPYRLAQQQHHSSLPDLILVPNYDTVGVQTLVTIDVRLGTSAMPIDSLYGISMRITADANLIDTTLTIIDPTTTWLGNTSNSFNFRKYFRSNGTVDFAECRKDHHNFHNGNGTIATFRIVTTDNVSGIQVCHLHLSNVTAVTIGQEQLQFNLVDSSVVIDPAHPAGVEESGAVSLEFGVYPNPASNEININTAAVADEILITDMLGQVVMSEKPTGTLTNVNTSSLPNGTYFIQVRKANSVSTQKLVITR